MHKARVIVQRERYTNLTRSSQSRNKTKIRRKATDKSNALFLSAILFRGNSVIITSDRSIFAGARTYRSHGEYGRRTKETEMKELATEWYGATIVYTSLRVRIYSTLKFWHGAKCKLFQVFVLRENNCFLFDLIKNNVIVKITKNNIIVKIIKRSDIYIIDYFMQKIITHMCVCVCV